MQRQEDPTASFQKSPQREADDLSSCLKPALDSKIVHLAPQDSFMGPSQGLSLEESLSETAQELRSSYHDKMRLKGQGATLIGSIQEPVLKTKNGHRAQLPQRSPAKRVSPMRKISLNFQRELEPSFVIETAGESRRGVGAESELMKSRAGTG